jgi:HTH-type transcriptional regulator / antitoxin HigA
MSIETSGKRQSDLVGTILVLRGSANGSSSVVSEIVNGKRTISKAQAKKLGEIFQVSPSLFI